jgi:hypothetical protein
MFRIRAGHDAALGAAALEQFMGRAVQHLRRDLATQTAGWSDEELRQRVMECIPRAGAYGLATQRELMCFVDVSFLLGNSFDTDLGQVWAAKLLRSAKLSAGDRANLLLSTACSVRGNARQG